MSPEGRRRHQPGLGWALLLVAVIIVIVIVVAAATPRPADLPDHAGAGNLNERAVVRPLEHSGGVRLPEIPHRAVVHQVRAAVRTELEVRRAVNPTNPRI